MPAVIQTFGYVYLTINQINHRAYVGKRSGVFKWWYVGSGKIIKQAVQKYGRENFTVEVLQQCDSQEELNQAEKDWIVYLNAHADPDFYNIAMGGEGNLGLKHTPESLALMSRPGPLNPMFGRRHKDLSIAAMRVALKGRPSSMKGRSHTDESKAKISAAKTGVKQSEERAEASRAALELARAKAIPARAVTATRLSDGGQESYPSVQAAADILGCKPRNIYHALAGYNQSSNKRTWQYDAI